MINLINKYKQAFTIVGAISVLTVCYFQQRELSKLRVQVKQANTDSLVNTINTLQHERDSLYDENFPCQIDKGRYEVAFTIFAERNPKAAEQFAEIISSETE